MRLGVSPTAASTPTGVLNQRFEALFPRAGALGCKVCFAPPPFLSIYLCANVGPRGLLAVALRAPFYNLPPCWVCQSSPSSESSLPGCPSLPLLPVWMNVSSLSPWLSDFMQFDFLSVLVFVFKLLLSFFWLFEEAQCVYQCLYLGRKLYSLSY